MGDTTADSREGSQFGPYLLRRVIGRGGMGDVYEAEDTVRERTVALKLMSQTLSTDPVFRSRMQREARTAGRLQEPHVVPIHDFGEIDGQLYVDMRLIDGKDLATMLSRYGPLSPPRAVAIVRQIGSALDAAHAAGVLHRDVKPENILVSNDDFAYLVDFGIASATADEKLTQIGMTVGTVKYMAPERFSDSEITHRADIYALACVLYECLTGSTPYTGDQVSVMGAHLHQAIPQPSAARPGIPVAFDGVVARGMAKDPADRYATCGDLSAAAYAALAEPDQDRATDILQRSQVASYCVVAQNDAKLYTDFYSGLFASNFQPAEDAAEDRTDGELAQLAKTVGTDADVMTCIKSGDDVGTGKAKSANGYATLSGLNANSTPFVWDGTASVNYQDPTWLTKLIG